MSRTVCEHFNPIDQQCDQCSPETRQTLELELARHANLIRQIFNSTYAPRKPLTEQELEDLRQAGGSLNFVTLRAFRVIARAIERAHGIGEQT